VRVSGYPIIAVLKTTSPDTDTSAPKEKPSNLVPSSRTRTAAFLLDISEEFSEVQRYGKNRRNKKL
jgi:hypothetical protein